MKPIPSKPSLVTARRVGSNLSPEVISPSSPTMSRLENSAWAPANQSFDGWQSSSMKAMISPRARPAPRLRANTGPAQVRVDVEQVETKVMIAVGPGFGGLVDDHDLEVAPGLLCKAFHQGRERGMALVVGTTTEK